jgi:hypothetical protein
MRSTERHCLLIPSSRSYLCRSTAGFRTNGLRINPFSRMAASAADGPGEQRHHLPPSGMSWGEAAPSALADFFIDWNGRPLSRIREFVLWLVGNNATRRKGIAAGRLLNAGSRVFARWRGSGVPELAAGFALRARTDCTVTAMVPSCCRSAALGALAPRVARPVKFSRAAKQ